MNMNVESASSGGDLINSGSGPGLVAGRYRLRERIGGGRLGEIFIADDQVYRGLGVRKTVALQILREDLLQNEALFSKLQWGFGILRNDAHPGIVTYSDFRRDGMFGYLVQEQLDGASLRKILDIATTVDIDEASAIIRAVADALRYLHEKSMVHGNVTPSNVFVTFEHEVRLLDTVPLVPAVAIPSHGAAPDTFASLDLRDDIYALAVLAYEMLTGRHPFNFHTPEVVHSSALRPARIDCLSERQWQAILRALSPGRDERFASVADFLQEFGITGSERMPLPGEAATSRDLSTGHSRQQPPESEQPVVKSFALTTDAVATATSVRATGENFREGALAARRDSGSRRQWYQSSPLLLMALLGLGGWFLFGQPRDDIGRISAHIDPYLAAISARVQDPGSYGISDGDAVFSSGETSSADASTDGDVAAIEVGSGSPEVFTAADADGQVVVEPPPTAPAAEPPELLGETETVSDAAGSDSFGAEMAAAGNSEVAGQIAGPVDAIFSEPVVRVSERASVARVTITRNSGAKDRVFWWTSDQSAHGDIDFIATERPVPGFTSGQQTETLHIPLVNDSIPESPEVFFVHLGTYDESLRRFERLSMVRVEITDDDSR
jgi:serine/threonine protein kinase